VNLSRSEFLSRWRSLSEKVGWVLLMFGASRLVMVAVIIYSRQIVQRGPHVIVSGQEQHGGTLLDVMTQWDGVWYRLIAAHGYGGAMPPVAAAFFPLYPLAVRVVGFVVRDLQVASLLVSNFSLLGAALLLSALLRLDYDEQVCRRAITFLMFNPVSFFLSAAYTESTFLLLSVGALYAARRGKWWAAGVCGGLLSATRPPGLIIGAPLLAEHWLQWRQEGQGAMRLFRPRLLWLGVVPLGLLAYFFYWYMRHGDWLWPMHAQQLTWKKTLAWPWQTFLWPQNFTPSHIPLYQAIVGAAVVLTAAGFFLRIRATYLVYAASALAFYLTWDTLEGLPRYVSILFPIHLVLALLSTRWRWLYEPLLGFSIALFAYCTVLFANAYQIT
jgi:Mannosyltransferase (PIG-V)